MKLLFLIVHFGVLNHQPVLNRLPQSTTDRPVACDSREVAKAIQGRRQLPKANIFHYGKREMLLKDIQARNIPQQDWDQYIMGEDTRFKLKRFRRGLYGTEFVEDADQFGDATYDWLMEIRLNSRCLKSKRMASVVYLQKSEDFKKWYATRKNSVSWEDFGKQCFDAEGYPLYQQFVNYRNPKENADFSESTCEKTAADYYESEKLALIQDYAGDLTRSWAIRDRNCIENIEGSDEYWAKAFATREEFWVNECHRERNHRNNIRVWFTAMANAGISVKYVKNFEAMIRMANPPEDKTDWQTEETDRFAAQDFAGTLLYMVEKCGTQRASELKNELREIALHVDDLQSSDVKTKLESVCR